MNKINHKAIKVFYILFFTILYVSLCSCQKQGVVIRMDLASEPHQMDDFSVVNGDYQDALKRCQESLGEIHEDSIEAAHIYKAMGGIYAEYLEDEELAVEYIEKAIQIDEKENDEIGLAQDYNQLSKIYISIGGNAQEGLQYLDKAEEIYKRYGLENTFEMAGTFSNKGELYNKLGDYETGIEYLKKAQEIYKYNQEEDIVICIKIGQSFLELKEYGKAEKQYLNAKKLCEETGDEYYLAETLYQLAWLYGEQEKYETAILHYEQALDYFRETGNLNGEARVYNSIAYDGYKSGWKAHQVLPMFIEACRTIEKASPETSSIEESKLIYKYNLEMHYKGWTRDMSDERFEAWYKAVVLEGRDWDFEGQGG